MFDKNGVDIKVGDVVRITGGYFKSDNGYWFVSHAPGDPSWLGSDISLHKISASGKISKAKYSTAFWPLSVTTNSWEKRAAAKAWNAEHAEIEVVNSVDRKEVADHFAAKARNERGVAEEFRRRGRCQSEIDHAMNRADFAAAVADRIGKEVA